MNYDLFFNFNNSLEKKNIFLTRQDNVLAHSYLSDSFEDLKEKFKQLLNEEIDQENMLLEITENHERKAKLGVSLMYDSFLKVLNLIGCNDRLLLNKIIFRYKHEPYFNM